MIRAHFTANPFYVLGLRPDCSRADLEREGQKLLGLLELGIAAAKTHATPLGPVPRTADSVRQAMAELRDPRRRLMHELWAQLPAGPADPDATAPAAPSPAPSAAAVADPAAAAESAATYGPPPAWPQARALFGFGAPR